MFVPSNLLLSTLPATCLCLCCHNHPLSLSLTPFPSGWVLQPKHFCMGCMMFEKYHQKNLSLPLGMISLLVGCNVDVDDHFCPHLPSNYGDEHRSPAKEQIEVNLEIRKLPMCTKTDLAENRPDRTGCSPAPRGRNKTYIRVE